MRLPGPTIAVEGPAKRTKRFTKCQIEKVGTLLMAAARTETGTRKNPASVVAPSVSLFLSPSGEQPPTGEKTVMASQLGTIPITRLLPLLLRQRDVLIETGLARRTLYQYMKDGLFPFPVMVGPKTVRWTRTSILAYQEGLQPAWHTSNGQGQEPGVVNYPAGTSRPPGSNKLLDPIECAVTITLTKRTGNSRNHLAVSRIDSTERSHPDPGVVQKFAQKSRR